MSVILWGAGNFGMRFYEKFRNEIAEPLFWVDAKKHGQMIQGIKVISPDDFWKYYNESCGVCSDVELIVTVRSVAAMQIVAELLQKSFFLRGGKLKFAYSLYAQRYFLNHSDDIKAVENMLNDEISINTYGVLIDNMCSGRIVDVSLYTEKQYFPNSIINTFAAGDVLVDAGVCDGEEIDTALEMNPDIKVLAFEPNQESFCKLQNKYRSNKNVMIYPCALWDKNIKVTGRGEELLSYKCTEVSDDENGINTVKLGDIAKCRIDFIKMDIEGAEVQALLGAKETIIRYKPNLAICIYHNIEDYIEIPLLIKSWNLDYDYYIRHHTVADTETVFYAVRRE